jgi:hypothetical protein
MMEGPFRIINEILFIAFVICGSFGLLAIVALVILLLS